MKLRRKKVPRTFTAWGILKEAYAVMKPRLWHIIGRYSTFALIFIATDVVVHKFDFLEFIVSLLFSFCSVLFGLTYIEGKEDYTLDLVLRKMSSKKFWRFVFSYALSTLAIIGGSILLVIYLIFNREPNLFVAVLAFPGMIIAIQLYFVKFIAVDRAPKPREALKESVRITKGHRFELVEYLIVAIVVNIIGALALVAGLFFTIPLTLIGTTLIYKKLSGADTQIPDNAETKPEVVEAEIVDPA